MDVKESVKGQYLAALAMLRQSIERCPEDIWLSGEFPRAFWRIAYHAVFYADFYLAQNLDTYKEWSKHRESATNLWPKDEEGKPTQPIEPYTKTEVLEYLDSIASVADERIKNLDLESSETGFYWYKNMNKLDHVLLNIRHIQGHVGQLSEILMVYGIDVDWVGVRRSAAVPA